MQNTARVIAEGALITLMNIHCVWSTMEASADSHGRSPWLLVDNAMLFQDYLDFYTRMLWKRTISRAS